MRTVLVLGLAFTAVTMTASAQPERAESRMQIHGHGHRIDLGRVDANNDGFVTRDEAAAEADRVFDELDTNDDGRLDTADRRARRIVRHALSGAGEGADVLVFRTDRRETGDDHRTVRVIRRGADPDDRRNVRREVVILDREGDVDWEEEVVEALPAVPAIPAVPAAPRAPAPPHPPMHMMLLMSSDESDLNGDGALSREEFRAQHLRFFDAGDANRDGRIRLRIPEMPEPPAAPAPPAPPRR